MSKQNQLNQFFKNMWDDYCKLNPQAEAVYQSLTQAGETVVNDHIAFRTFSHPQINAEKLSHVILNFGYTLAGEYKFEEKKLNARHFEHFDVNMPKIFISELDLSLVSSYINEVVANSISELKTINTTDEKFLYSGRPWKASFETYKKLAVESEYAAWVYAIGFRPNHFTVYVNHLKKYNNIFDLNQFLKNNGFKLNSSGGEVKGTPSEFLEQSSTLANLIEVKFDEGTYSIPACYYEFAKRYPQPNGKIYQGFIAKSADKIFESTHRQ